MADWRRFAERIIESKGNPSVRDAKECEVPIGYFNELCMRNISSEKLVENAQKLLQQYSK